MILVLDNYDSFTYNLVQMLQVRRQRVDVRCHDDHELLDCSPNDYQALVVGPGPGKPEDAGSCLSVLRLFWAIKPILGVCLGHQALAMLSGAELVLAPEPMHGRVVPIHHCEDGLYRGLPLPFQATRYHSLVIRRETLPAALKVTAWTHEGLVMGLQHREHAVHGVQFHPESIASEGGGALIDNFLESIK